ncbi:conjugative transfer protein TraN [Legionella busanensis]|uniref:Conjugative transfer protein TraN n=1 Tax=Legionella busanensis TaxID=190655 RepID=A0A378K9S9_9GAMM|nr:conjugal transfer protein TraN [Legionella busanensis]STX81708.1 conjugative transfer protein TraN [Legionella busanensis]
MIKYLSFFVCVFLFNSAFSGNTADVNNARDQALQALKQFNPQTIIKEYSEHPPEANITAAEGTSHLPELGSQRARLNDTATTILSQASRPHLKANPNALEMQYAETLLSEADGVLEGKCYEQLAHCQMDFTTKTCEDKTTYRNERCGSTLSIGTKTAAQTVNRYLFYDNKPGAEMLRKTIHLNACDAETPAPLCSANNLITVSTQCIHLAVLVSQGGLPLIVLKPPSCQDPTVTFDLLWDEAAFGGTVTITAVESQFEDHWSAANCTPFDEKIKEGACVITGSDLCLEPNTSRIIDGVVVYRPCWGKYSAYQCIDGLTSTCEPLFSEGCSQIDSKCRLATERQCEAFVQTFRCPVNHCFPKQTICQPKLSCTQGECTETKDEASDDVAEGLTRLGALAGTAADVSANQINLSEPSIFKGATVECDAYPLGIHDCCHDKGWGKWAIHCPQNLQQLLKAKQAKRVHKVGHYKKNLIKHYVYCVFPSTLAGLVQTQGRFGQLHIGFGKPKAPDCRGLTPEELERIQFDALDLSALASEFTERQTLPDATGVGASNEAKITRLYQEGKAHD